MLVGPRIELPALHGLRVEDLVFVALGALCVLHSRGLGRPAGPSLAIVGVVAAGLLSALVATGRGMVDPVTSVLFAVRPIEYWIAFPAALLLLRSAEGRWLRRVDVLLVVVTVLQSGFAIAQYFFGLEVGFSHASYARAAGLTVGPYELGAISAALTVFWVGRGRFTLGSLAAIALAASISRVSLLGAGIALTVLLLFWVVRQIGRVRRTGARGAFRVPAGLRLRAAGQVLSVVAAVFVLGLTLGVLQPPAAAEHQAGGTGGPRTSAPSSASASAPASAESSAPAESDEPDGSAATPEPGEPESGPKPPSDSIAQRLEGTSILGSWSVANRLAEGAPPVHTSAEYADVAYGHLNAYVTAESAAAQGAEPSNLVRFFRWHLILNTIDDPVDLLFGLGPSFTGPSVDGSYLRMLADGGLLGLAAWIVLIVVWLRRNPLWMRCVTIALLVGALFIDILYAQRPMVLYWLLLAVAAAETGPAAVRHRHRRRAGGRRPSHGSAPAQEAIAPGSQA